MATKSTKSTKPTMAFHHFNSVADQRDFNSTPCNRSENDNLRSSYSDMVRDVSTYGFRGNMETINGFIMNGFPQGLSDIETMYDRVFTRLPKAIGVGRSLRRGDNGDTLDIHAVNRGAVDRAWSKSVRTVKKAPLPIQLIVDIGGNCDVSANQLRYRGVAASALAQIMVTAGYSVEIVAAFATTRTMANNNTPIVISTTIKPRGGRVDKNLLSSTVCLPGFFRTYGFVSLVRACDNVGATTVSSLGQALPVQGIYPSNSALTQLVIPMAVRDEETATNWVKNTITLLQGI